MASSATLFDDSELDTLHAVARGLQDGREGVVHLCMINPDLAPPRLLLDKLVEAAMKPVTHRYAVSRGVARLRQAFSERYQRVFGVTLDAEKECCVTLGAKDAVLTFLRALRAGGKVSAGARVALPAPVYPAHRAAVVLAELEPCFVAIEPGMSDEALAAAWITTFERERPSVALLNFPHNPTGRILSAELLANIAAAANQAGVYLLNDFAYGELSYALNPAPSLLRAFGRDFSGSRTVEVYTMSKVWSVPGWRVGVLAGDPELVRLVAKLKSWSDYGQFLPLQSAAAAALESRNDLPGEARGIYRRRTEVLARGLGEAGWRLDGAPQAGVSVWAEAPTWILQGGRSAAERILLDRRIMAMPGLAFGERYGSWVRFAAVLPEEKLREVLLRLQPRSAQGIPAAV